MSKKDITKRKKNEVIYEVKIDGQEKNFDNYILGAFIILFILVIILILI